MILHNYGKDYEKIIKLAKKLLAEFEAFCPTQTCETYKTYCNYITAVEKKTKYYLKF